MPRRPDPPQHSSRCSAGCGCSAGCSLNMVSFIFFMAVAANTGTRPFSFSITSYIKQYEPSLSGPLLSGFLVPAYAGGHQAGHHGKPSPAPKRISGPSATSRWSPLTYESTFGALEKASEDLHLGWGRIMHLDSVNDEPAQRGGHRGKCCRKWWLSPPPCR